MKDIVAEINGIIAGIRDQPEPEEPAPRQKRVVKADCVPSGETMAKFMAAVAGTKERQPSGLKNNQVKSSGSRR